MWISSLPFPVLPSAPFPTPAPVGADTPEQAFHEVAADLCRHLEGDRLPFRTEYYGNAPIELIYPYPGYFGHTRNGSTAI